MPRERLDILTECLLTPSAREPHGTALVRGEARIRYRSLRDRTAALATAMQAEGIEVGDTVALLLNDGVDLVAHLLAVLACGGCALPLAADSGVADVARALEAAEPKLAVASATLAPDVLAEVSRRARTVRVGRRGMSSIEALERAGSRRGQAFAKSIVSKSDALRFFIDDVDGSARLITFTHKTVVLAIRRLGEVLPLDEVTRVGALGPFHQPACLIGEVLATLAAGETLYCPDPDASSDALAEWYGHCRLSALGAPSRAIMNLATALLAASGPVEDVKEVLLWGSPLTPDDRALLRRAFPKSKLMRWLGLDPETGLVTLRRIPEPGVVERGGEIVAPAAVEATLHVIPGVEDAAVVGVADPAHPEPVLVAFVVSPEKTDEKGWREFAAAQLAPARRPDRYVNLDALPRGDGGEIDRADLARRALETIKRSRARRKTK